MASLSSYVTLVQSLRRTSPPSKHEMQRMSVSFNSPFPLDMGFWFGQRRSLSIVCKLAKPRALILCRSVTPPNQKPPVVWHPKVAPHTLACKSTTEFLLPYVPVPSEYFFSILSNTRLFQNILCIYYISSQLQREDEQPNRTNNPNQNPKSSKLSLGILELSSIYLRWKF